MEKQPQRTTPTAESRPDNFEPISPKDSLGLIAIGVKSLIESAGRVVDGGLIKLGAETEDVAVRLVRAGLSDGKEKMAAVTAAAVIGASLGLSPRPAEASEYSVDFSLSDAAVSERQPIASSDIETPAVSTLSPTVSPPPLKSVTRADNRQEAIKAGFYQEKGVIESVSISESGELRLKVRVGRLPDGRLTVIDRLAARFNLDATALATANVSVLTDNPDLLLPGEVLKVHISRPLIYKVEAGMTLGKIAAKTGVMTAYELAELNQIQNPDLIFQGQRLILPIEGSTANSDQERVITDLDEIDNLRRQNRGRYLLDRQAYLTAATKPAAAVPTSPPPIEATAKPARGNSNEHQQSPASVNDSPKPPLTQVGEAKPPPVAAETEALPDSEPEKDYLAGLEDTPAVELFDLMHDLYPSVWQSAAEVAKTDRGRLERLNRGLSGLGDLVAKRDEMIAYAQNRLGLNNQAETIKYGLANVFNWGDGTDPFAAFDADSIEHLNQLTLAVAQGASLNQLIKDIRTNTQTVNSLYHRLAGGVPELESEALSEARVLEIAIDVTGVSQGDRSLVEPRSLRDVALGWYGFVAHERDTSIEAIVADHIRWLFSQGETGASLQLNYQPDDSLLLDIASQYVRGELRLDQLDEYVAQFRTAVERIFTFVGDNEAAGERVDRLAFEMISGRRSGTDIRASLVDYYARELGISEEEYYTRRLQALAGAYDVEVSDNEAAKIAANFSAADNRGGLDGITLAALFEALTQAASGNREPLDALAAPISPPAEAARDVAESDSEIEYESIANLIGQFLNHENLSIRDEADRQELIEAVQSGGFSWATSCARDGSERFRVSANPNMFIFFLEAMNSGIKVNVIDVASANAHSCTSLHAQGAHQLSALDISPNDELYRFAVDHINSGNHLGIHELIHWPPPDGLPTYKRGRPFNYSSRVRGAHQHHIHIGFFPYSGDMESIGQRRREPEPDKPEVKVPTSDDYEQIYRLRTVDELVAAGFESLSYLNEEERRQFEVVLAEIPSLDEAIENYNSRQGDDWGPRIPAAAVAAIVNDLSNRENDLDFVATMMAESNLAPFVIGDNDKPNRYAVGISQFLFTSPDESDLEKMQLLLHPVVNLMAAVYEKENKYGIDGIWYAYRPGSSGFERLKDRANQVFKELIAAGMPDKED